MKQNTPFSKKEKVKGKEKSEKVGSNVSAGEQFPHMWMKKIQYSTEKQRFVRKNFYTQFVSENISAKYITNKFFLKFLLFFMEHLLY